MGVGTHCTGRNWKLNNFWVCKLITDIWKITLLLVRQAAGFCLVCCASFHFLPKISLFGPSGVYLVWPCTCYTLYPYAMRRNLAYFNIHSWCLVLWTWSGDRVWISEYMLAHLRVNVRDRLISNQKTWPFEKMKSGIEFMNIVKQVCSAESFSFLLCIAELCFIQMDLYSELTGFMTL